MTLYRISGKKKMDGEKKCHRNSSTDTTAAGGDTAHHDYFISSPEVESSRSSFDKGSGDAVKYE